MKQRPIIHKYAIKKYHRHILYSGIHLPYIQCNCVYVDIIMLYNFVVGFGVKHVKNQLLGFTE